MYRLRMESALLVGVAWVAVACSGSESIGPSLGGLEVAATTTGVDLDPDGYTVALDGAAGRPLARNGTVTFSALSGGNHTVALGGVASNCAVSGHNPVTVRVTSGATARAGFQIACDQIRAASILVSPYGGGVAVGGTLQLTPTCKDQSGVDLPCPSLVWSTNDPTVATVSQSGMVTGVATGSVIVRYAAAGPRGGEVIVYVDRPGSVTLAVTPQAWTMVIGDSVLLQAAIQDTAGNALTGRTSMWTSSDPTVATVSSLAYWGAPRTAAFVKSAAPGSATITASYADASGRAAITVEVGSTVQVTASTTGADPDPDGYTVALDGRAQSLTINGATTFSRLTSGTYTVTLSGVALNCSVSGQNPAAVTVTPGARAEIAFQIACSRIDGTIAFSSDRDGSMDIYVMNAIWGVIQLTNNPNYGPGDGAPAWSPDGKKVAFVSTRDVINDRQQIYVMNADGSNITKLTDLPSFAEGPSWSPDGTRIAFWDYFGGIYVISRDGSNLVKLSDDGSAPAWSPDGTRITFVADRDGSSDIYTMNRDGSGTTRLTIGGAIDRFSRPVWSPDGKTIAFATSRNGFCCEIYVMNADGSGANRLTPALGRDQIPDWSPDGTKIAFQRVNSASNHAEIWVVNADGSSPTLLADDGWNNSFPAWKP